jgi:hypothetical protein
MKEDCDTCIHYKKNDCEFGYDSQQVKKNRYQQCWGWEDEALHKLRKEKARKEREYRKYSNLDILKEKPFSITSNGEKYVFNDRNIQIVEVSFRPTFIGDSLVVVYLIHSEMYGETSTINASTHTHIFPLEHIDTISIVGDINID